MDYDNIQKTLLNTIKDYFKYTIQRPELLNRIGDNFVVFDFIREKAIEEILNLKLSAVISYLEHEKGLKLEIKDPYKKYLIDEAKQDLSNGGRGISNLVETSLINPLSQVLVKEQWKSGNSIIIQSRPMDNALFEYSIIQA